MQIKIHRNHLAVMLMALRESDKNTVIFNIDNFGEINIETVNESMPGCIVK